MNSSALSTSYRCGFRPDHVFPAVWFSQLLHDHRFTSAFWLSWHMRAHRADSCAEGSVLGVKSAAEEGGKSLSADCGRRGLTLPPCCPWGADMLPTRLPRAPCSWRRKSASAVLSDMRGLCQTRNGMGVRMNEWVCYCWSFRATFAHIMFAPGFV